MTIKWTGSNTNNDIKAATRTGIIFKTWEPWEMYGLNGNDTLTGGEANDRIFGGEGRDDLSGLDGNDFLNGGEGVDRMAGGKGHDIFVVDHESDQVIERDGEGTDTVQSYAWSYTLPRFVENLRLMDDENGAGRIARGNSGANTIYGNKWGNRIFGMEGDDTIFGSGGGDYIEGGDGNDKIYTASEDTAAKIFGQAGNDFLGGGGELHGGIGNDTYGVTTNDQSVIIENADEGYDTVQVVHRMDQNGRIVDEPYQMSESMANIEKVELVGFSKHLQGNSNANLLVANSAVGSILSGMGGDDGLIGMGGDDVLLGGTGNDAMQGGAGNDFISGFGGSNPNANTGRDHMQGGAGRDTFALGDFYLDAGYAVIADFSRQEGDKVQIKGQSSNFVIRPVDMVGSRDKYDAGLYLKTTDSLIAVFSDNTSLALNTDFQFVS